MKKITTKHILFIDKDNKGKSKFIIDLSDYREGLKRREYLYYGAGWTSKFKSGDKYISLTISDDINKGYKFYVSKNQHRIRKSYPEYTIRKKKSKEQDPEIVGNLYNGGSYLYGSIKIDDEKYNIALVKLARQSLKQPDWHVYIEPKEKIKIDKRKVKKAKQLPEDERG